MIWLSPPFLKYRMPELLWKSTCQNIIKMFSLLHCFKRNEWPAQLPIPNLYSILGIYIIKLFSSFPGDKRLNSDLAWLGLGVKASLINQCNLHNRTLPYWEFLSGLCIFNYVPCFYLVSQLNSTLCHNIRTCPGWKRSNLTSLVSCLAFGTYKSPKTLGKSLFLAFNMSLDLLLGESAHLILGWGQGSSAF